MRNSMLKIGILLAGLCIGLVFIGVGISQLFTSDDSPAYTLDDAPVSAYLDDLTLHELTLGITPQQFGVQVNALLQPYDLDVFDLREAAWSHVTLADNTRVDVFVITYPKQIVLIGSVDPNGEIISLEYQLQSNKKMAKSVKEYSLLTMSATKVLNHEMTSVEALNYTTNLMMQVVSDFNRDGGLQTSIKVLNGRVYIAQLSKFTGKYRIEPYINNQFETDL